MYNPRKKEAFLKMGGLFFAALFSFPDAEKPRCQVSRKPLQALLWIL